MPYRMARHSMEEVRAVVYRPKRANREDRCALAGVILMTVVCIGIAGGGGGFLWWYLYTNRDNFTYQYPHRGAGIINNASSTAAMIDFRVTTAKTTTIVTTTDHTEDDWVPSRDNVSNAELSELMQGLWEADRDRLPDTVYEINLQGQTNVSGTEDYAPERLFTTLGVDLGTLSPIYSALLSLKDIYNPNVREMEYLFQQDLQNIDLFLDRILETSVVADAHYFLVSKGYAHYDRTHFKEQLYSMWFELYNRSPKYNFTDSCGFEHIFLGERRGSKTLGFHNWVQFYREEQAGSVDYQGYISYAEPRSVSVQLLWYGRRKKQASFFIGTSPEFDFAVYTVCFLIHPSKHFSFTINSHPIKIHTQDVTHKPGLQLSTANLAVP